MFTTTIGLIKYEKKIIFWTPTLIMSRTRKMSRPSIQEHAGLKMVDANVVQEK